MKKISFSTLVSIFFLSIIFCFSQPGTVSIAAATTATSNCTYVNVKGTFTTRAEEALSLINSYRKEACEQGYPDPRDPDRSLTVEDYVPAKWSETLEEAAQIRAAESLLCPVYEQSGDQNQRPNGTSCDTVLAPYFEGYSYNYAERIEPSTNLISIIKEWHAGYDNGVSDFGYHGYYRRAYAYMINPANTYVALATFESDLTDDSASSALFFGSSDTIPEANFHKDISRLASHRTQKIEILKSELKREIDQSVINANIVKKAQSIKVSASAKTVSYKKCKKTAQKTSVVAVTGAKGKVTYKKVSGSSRLKIGSTNGKITVAKKTKKGTYSIKIKVTAASKGLYAKATKTLTIKVKVK